MKLILPRKRGRRGLGSVLINAGLLILSLIVIGFFQSHPDPTSGEGVLPQTDSQPLVQQSQEIFTPGHGSAGVPENYQPVSRININSATASELEGLPGIGPKLAAAIIQYRAEHGEFVSLNQIKMVRGIGAKRLLILSERITVAHRSPD